MAVGSGINIKTTDPADIPTPDTDKITIFADSTNADEPSYKNDAGVVSTLVGATGSAGPVGGLGPPGMEGDQGEDSPLVPGPQGIQGITGATGAVGPAGPITIGPMGLDGDQGEDGFPIPPAPSVAVGADWRLIESRVCTVNANEDFINLAGYNEILVVIKAITRSISGITTLRVSIDNGASFLATAADYLDVSVAGVEGGIDRIPIHTTNATAARSGRVLIQLFDTASIVKMAEAWDGNTYFIPTANALNAVRVYSGTAGGNLTGGTIFIYGR